MAFLIRTFFPAIIAAIISLFEFIFRRDEFYQIIAYVWNNPLKTLLWAVTIWYLFIVTVIIIRWLYLERRAKNLIFISLPLLSFVLTRCLPSLIAE